MAKKSIVVLYDRTGKAASSILAHERLRIFQVLDLTSIRQVARYDDGGATDLDPLVDFDPIDDGGDVGLAENIVAARKLLIRLMA